LDAVPGQYASPAQRAPARVPFGLAGSGGSSPMRLRQAGQPGGYLFGKLYARSHVRADRWYKLGRQLLYGRLEDEQSFKGVRRLVQQEDYALRLCRAAGLPSPEPYGLWNSHRTGSTCC
jgi:hypothetical protein